MVKISGAETPAFGSFRNQGLSIQLLYPPPEHCPLRYGPNLEKQTSFSLH